MKNIHPLSEVNCKDIGKNTRVWQFTIILAEATIGDNCNIQCHTFIENKVTVGNNVTIKPGVYLWDGITVEDDVFIGPNVTFTNDKYPKANNKKFILAPITLKKGCSIGANATILGGVTIGKHALIGAGSLVCKEVPDYALVYGNPAKIKGWVDINGSKLLTADNKQYTDQSGNKYIVKENKLFKL